MSNIKKRNYNCLNINYNCIVSVGKPVLFLSSNNIINFYGNLLGTFQTISFVLNNVSISNFINNHSCEITYLLVLFTLSIMESYSFTSKFYIDRNKILRSLVYLFCDYLSFFILFESWQELLTTACAQTDVYH